MARVILASILACQMSCNDGSDVTVHHQLDDDASGMLSALQPSAKAVNKRRTHRRLRQILRKANTILPSPKKPECRQSHPSTATHRLCGVTSECRAARWIVKQLHTCQVSARRWEAHQPRATRIPQIQTVLDCQIIAVVSELVVCHDAVKATSIQEQSAQT